MNPNELEDTKLENLIIYYEPSLFKVVFLNDDYTTMEFVVNMLMKYFGHSSDEAFAIMMAIHEKGRGVCGIYPYEIAETKAVQVRQEAGMSDFPLRVLVEEE